MDVGTHPGFLGPLQRDRGSRRSVLLSRLMVARSSLMSADASASVFRSITVADVEIFSPILQRQDARRSTELNSRRKVDRRRFAKSEIAPKVHVGSTTEPEVADTAFIVEVVEHMDDAALGAAFAEIYRALKPGGHVVITTPNDENLEANRVLCPECFAIFHVMQHVRSWKTRSLSAFTESQGFETVSVDETILSPHTGLLDRLWRFAKLYGGARPNLIYIGRKL